MKASELIAVLTELMNKHGDVTVMMTVDWTSSVSEATYHEAKDGDVSDRTSWIPYIELA